MSTLVIRVEDGADARLAAAMRRLGGPLAEMHRAMGLEVQAITRDHIAGLKRDGGSMASKFGAPSSGFYAEAAAKVAGDSALSADAGGATLTVAHAGFARAFRTVTIRPKAAAALTLPVHPAAFGRRAGELWDRMGLFIPKGKRVICGVIGGVLTPFYMLARSVTQRQDRSLLPGDEAFREAAKLGAGRYIFLNMKGRR